jgi:dTDP-4-amino-4,6-dideoxygalactose transaminase
MTHRRRRRDEHCTVPFQQPALPPTDEIEKYFALSRAESWYSNSGPCHDLLAERASALLADRPVVPVSSGGIGLIAALRTLVPSSSGTARQVVLPSFTFAATGAAVVWCGLEPVFVDIEPDGWHLCPNRLRELLAARPGQIAAIVACCAFGTPPSGDIADAWCTAAEDAGVPLLVDSAAGFGAGGWDRAPDAEVFSMHATKGLAVGEGGLVAFDREEVAARARTVINHGIGHDHEAAVIGLNGKLDEWSAATALAALDTLPQRIARRRAAAQTMRDNLGASGLHFQALADRSTSQFVPALAPSPARRDEILARAASVGVELRTYYSPPLHTSPAYGASDRGDPLTVTTDVAGRIVSLPMSDDFSDEQQARVAECVGA